MRFGISASASTSITNCDASGTTASGLSLDSSLMVRMTRIDAKSSICYRESLRSFFNMNCEYLVRSLNNGI